MDAIYP
jgi:RP/EB family microtubule-associated protein